ncbi:MAG TPA: site-2 protease family protein [Candidatus Paceibacterota bacterium]
MTIILFILILGLLIFVHELGHFLAAKAIGARVDEFGLGFPPKLFSKKFKGTEYSLNILPLGGYVKIYGENPEEGELSDDNKKDNFAYKPKWQQAIVLVAGVTFNIILAWIFLSIGLMYGMPMSASNVDAGTLRDPELTVIQVGEGSPAQKAGLLTGDVVSSVNGNQTEVAELSVAGFKDIVATSNELSLEILRNGEVLKVDIKPETGVWSNDVPAIGVGLDMVGVWQLPPHKAVISGAKLTGVMLVSMTQSFGELIKIISTGDKKVTEVISGPIGIAGMVGDAKDIGWLYLLTFTAFISLNLAVINLVPFPALDGGRLLFLFIEFVKGSPINPKIVNTLNVIGFVLLITLMVVVSVGDIGRLF